MQWINEALNQIRRLLFSDAPRDALGRTLKAKKWMLLSAGENLEHQHKLQLNKLLELNQPLYATYLLKEQLRAMLKYPWERTGVPCDRLHELIVDVLGAGLPELRSAAHRIANHLDGVMAGHDHDVPFGLCEAINGKIRVLRFQARGYSDAEYSKLKIFQRCSLRDNPWARIVLRAHGKPRGATFAVWTRRARDVSEEN